MSRILAVTGVHLDRVWTDLGPDLGEELRQWSAALLAQLVEASRRLAVDQLVVVGDLFSRATTLPSTVEYAAAVLGSFEGPVVVVPGAGDWYGEGAPYTYGTWPPNVHVVATTAFTHCGTGASLWGSAWTGPAARTVNVPPDLRSADEGWAVRSGVPDERGLLDQLPGGVHLVTSGTAAVHSATHTVLTPLVNIGLDCAEATLLVRNKTAVSCEAVPLGESPVRTATLDVSGLSTDQALHDTLAALASQGCPTLVRVTGTLASEVLPPSHHEVPLPVRLVVDESRLEFPAPAPDPDDRTTKAEFLRAMAAVAWTPRERHVATAIGLQALTASGG